MKPREKKLRGTKAPEQKSPQARKTWPEQWRSGTKVPMAPAPTFENAGRSFMKLSSFLLLASSAACATPVAREVKSASISNEKETVVAESSESAELAKPIPELEGETGKMASKDKPRKVGDLWVHRFSGSYRGEAIILREEVTANDGTLLTVGYRLEEGDSITELEVKMTTGSERIVSVSRIEDGIAIAGTLKDLDEMMAKTAFIPDQNAGRVALKDKTCLVGSKELSCEVSEYKIFVGEEEALLSVAHNSALQRDIAGEITAVDGTVLYHAELIEMQRGDGGASVGDSVALNDPFLD